jgi:hypothetical protein
VCIVERNYSNNNNNKGVKNLSILRAKEELWKKKKHSNIFTMETI